MKHLKCAKCGIIDRSNKSIGHIGTAETMVCPDCCNYTGEPKLNKYGYKLAQLCRYCCPTKHGTKFID